MSVGLDLAHLRSVRRHLRSWLEAGGVLGQTRDDIILAAHEAVANAIEHATLATNVTIQGRRDANSVVVLVENRGKWRPPPSDDETRGRGLAVIREAMSSLEIDARRGRTVVRMRKQLEG